MKRSSVALTLFVFAALLGAPAARAKKEDPLAKYAQRVEVDAFNPRVTPQERLKEKPRRGGVLTARTAADPTNLNVLTHRDQGAATILGYMGDSLISRDPETFEYLPWVAKSWEIRDLVVLKNGQRLEGRVLSETSDTVTLAEDAGIVTLVTSDLVTLDLDKGAAKTKDGRVCEGKITPYQYTVEIEEKPKRQPRVIPLKDVAEYTDKIGNQEKTRKAVKRECVFYFPIREGVRWHDGVELSIGDYLFGWQTLQNPDVDAARIRSYYLDIESVEKAGPRTLKFTYRKPYFLALGICGGLDPLPRQVFKPENYAGDPKGFAKDFNNHPSGQPGGHFVGLGAYRLKSWVRDSGVAIERNPDHWAAKAGLPYWKPDQPYLDEIRWKVIVNPTAALKALQNGDVDADFDVEPGTWIREDTNSPEFKSRVVRARGVVPQFTYVGWNEDRVFFKDARVRQALTLLIPVEQILKDVHYGLGRVVTGPFFIDSPAYDHSLPVWPHDPNKAKTLLREAGWLDRDGDGILDNRDGVKFEFEYMIHTAREYHALIADIVKENLEKAGIRVTIRKLDWTVFIEANNDRKFDAMRNAWGADYDPDPFQIWHSSQIGNRGSNSVGYVNPEVDRLIEESREEFDAEKRWAMMRQIHRIIYNDQPYTFMFCFDQLFFYNAKFRGVKAYKVGDGYNFTEWYLGE